MTLTESRHLTLNQNFCTLSEQQTLDKMWKAAANNNCSAIMVVSSRGYPKGTVDLNTMAQAHLMDSGEKISRLELCPVNIIKRGHITNMDPENLLEMWQHREWKFPLVVVNEEKDKDIIEGIILAEDWLKLLEQNYHRLKARISTIYEAAGVILVNKNERITSINQAAINLLSLNHREVIDRLIVDVAPWIKVNSVFSEKSSKIWVIELQESKKILVNCVPLLENDTVAEVCITLHDVSNLSYLASQKKDSFFQSTLDNLKDIMDYAYEGIVIVDRKGFIKYTNEQNTSIFNLKPAEVMGKHITSLTPKSQMQTVLETGQPQIGTILKHNNREMVVNRLPIKNKNGEVLGAVGMVIFKDKKELEKLTEKLNLLESKVEYYHQELSNLRKARYSFDHIITRNHRVENIKNLSIRFAQGNYNILIYGESGTGKELFAHGIHQSSKRSNQPFIRVNCSAIPRELFESELFGYEEGAFTGASKKGKKGKFELAHKGTIFLDEIGDMPIETQSKLLRVVENKEIEKVGGEKVKYIDFRLITATNRNLEEMVNRGEFRQDLFYRLNVCRIDIPPLRERPEDIPLLVEHFLQILCREKGLDNFEYEIEENAIQLLQEYSWPGNVRELLNILERTVVSKQDGNITVDDLPVKKDKSYKFHDRDIHLYQLVQEVEKDAIKEALKRTGGNKRQASQILGIHRSVLYEKLKQYGISD